MVSRILFTDTPNYIIQENIGESLLFEKTIIRMFFVLAPILLISSIGLAFYFFKYWGFIFLIVFPIIYFLYCAQSSRGSSRLANITYFLIFILVSNFFSDSYFRFTVLSSLAILSLWCHRFQYKLGGIFVGRIALRSPKAYQWLREMNVICLNSI